MTSPKPTPLSLTQKARLVWLMAVSPEKFIQEEMEDNVRLNGGGPRQRSDSIRNVRKGYSSAFLWAVGAMVAGGLSGWALGQLSGASDFWDIAVSLAGGAILLWATLAVQGWSIQSFKGITLSERVNQWVFRSLYVLGTALISAGSVWSLF